MDMMVQYGLFTDPQGTASNEEKHVRYHALKVQLEDCEEKLVVLQSQASRLTETPPWLFEPPSSDTKACVPPEVYRILVYVEARAIQRARFKQEASGFFNPGSYRLWLRKLYSNVRQRMRLYERAKLKQDRLRLVREKSMTDTGVRNEALESLSAEDADKMWYERENESVLLNADEYAQWASISVRGNEAPPKEKRALVKRQLARRTFNASMQRKSQNDRRSDKLQPRPVMVS